MNVLTNLRSGLAGTEAAVDKEAGTLGYRAFTWGGLFGSWNSFEPPEKNLPDKTADVEACLGVTFTPDFTGDLQIDATLDMTGKGDVVAGAGALDALARLLGGPIGLIQPQRLLPSVSVIGTEAFVCATPTDHQSSRQLLGLGASYARLLPLPGPFGLPVFPTSQEHTYDDEIVVVTLTLPVQEGQVISIEAGLKSHLKSWGNATGRINLRDTQLESIVLTRK